MLLSGCSPNAVLAKCFANYDSFLRCVYLLWSSAQFCRLSPTIGCAPSRIHARALSSPNSRENAQNRWAHLEPFNLGFALKIVQRCPIYTLQNPPLCAFPDNPWNIEYSILQKTPLMSQCSFVPADPWSPLFWKFAGVVFFIIVRSGKNPATLFVAKSVRCEPGSPLAGFLRYFGNTHFNPSSIWYPHF